MKIYEITFNDEEKVSLVKSPAIESTLLKFSEEENEVLYFANEEKQVVYSVAMIPNKMIFRKNIQGEPANVFYTSETIEKFQQNYFRKSANSGTNVNHAEFNTDGIFPFESWIVANSENDKSKELGLTAPNGSLVMGFKIDNTEVWNEVKNGNLDGLSVEGRVLYEEVEPINTIIEMSTDKNPQNLWNAIKTFFVDEEVVVAEVKEEVVEESKEDKTAELEAENEMLKAKISELEAKLTDIEAEKVKAETDLVAMTKEIAAAEPIVQAPAIVDITKMSALEKFRYQKTLIN